MGGSHRLPPGYNTTVYHHPELDTTVVVAANSDVYLGKCPPGDTLLHNPTNVPFAKAADRIQAGLRKRSDRRTTCLRPETERDDVAGRTWRRFGRAIVGFNERSVEGMMTALAPNAEFKPLVAGVTDSPYRGEEGVREFLAATDEAFEVFHLHCERIEDHGEFVLAVNDVYARGRTSGAEVRQPIYQIAEFRDGKCIWFQSFRTRQEALEAAGLQDPG